MPVKRLTSFTVFMAFPPVEAIISYDAGGESRGSDYLIEFISFLLDCGSPGGVGLLF